ncbi:MAG TPA: ATP-grasp domain-containing protein, partial [Terriglobia bacterium]|nr:ATP-grasp domain-containing protein [Terriglobia bacterium]
AGIHSGDSSCVLPPYMISEKNLEEMIGYTVRLAKALKVVGLINIQFAMKDNVVYVLEVNPRASRTVPFVSKATGLPMAKIAAKVMLGKTIEELGLKDYDFRKVKHISVKEAVFPFAKFPQTPVFLGPEMRSTGEVMGISGNFGEAISKSQMGAGNTLPNSGRVFVSVNDSDKNEITLDIVRGFLNLGFSLVATEGTAKFLNDNAVTTNRIFKVGEGRPNVVDMVKNGDIQLIINTPLGESSRYDEYSIGWAALEHKVAYVSTLSAAATAVKGIESQQNGTLTVKSVQEYLKETG